MNNRVKRPAPRDVTDALNASVRDLAAGAVSDATSVQTEARRMLADYDRAHPGSHRPPPAAISRSALGRHDVTCPV